MTAYIAISFGQRHKLDHQLTIVVEVLRKFNFQPHVFVDRYQFDPTQEKQMMQQVMTNISNCDMLLAETTHKGIGIGIEAGYAKAQNKPVVYLRQHNAEHSTTLSGISDYQIIYESTEALAKQLSLVLGKIIDSQNDDFTQKPS
ncbi:nucleoside 2-deoxyribosyltransferase [Runella zeae]|uniref:nucleoside 2-deoxyribosyltransferase n=1 Tax=Runella zeae TaxID=94255 RepID=UPI002353D2B2|nr:nucleoside 2-deoxyribosyltransferase [Runella zeae]